MTHSDFLAARQTGIGGSDIATLMGVNPFSTRLELYLEKRGEIAPKSDTSRTKAGRVMESVIAAMVSERTGQKLRRVNRTLRHPKHDFLIAHIDRDVVGQKKGLEIKNVSPRLGSLWGRDGEPDQIAEYYLPQPHHYMLVMDYPAFDVAAYFGGDDLRLYPMERDREMDDMIISLAHDFWHNHVLKGIPPEPDFAHPTTRDMLRRAHPSTNGKEIIADEMIRHWAAVARDAAEKAASYQKVADAATNHLLHFMGEADTLRLDDAHVFERKKVKRKGYEVAPAEYIQTRFKTRRD
ncbi:MAG: YqaJ viral recombinase family protein [Oxalobacter formigenes]|nr:YqaJ viral recombinase family protein [Oxalobacter formigenes]